MKTKIAYLCSSKSWGGLEMNHLRNAQWMQQRGHNICFLCVKNTPIADYALENKIPIHFIDSHKKYYDFKKARVLSKYLSANDFTHLIIRSTSDMSITASIKRKLKTKIQTAYFMEMQLGVKKTNLLHTLRFKYIDVWSCPLNWLAEQVNTMTNFKNKTVVIPSGLELSKFEHLVEPAEAREKLNLPVGKFIFGLIGRFDPQKGQLLLLEAMKKCQSTNFDIVFLGEPTLHEGDEYYAQMQQIIEDKNLKDRVHIRPFMNDVSIFFKAVDWFVMATKAETFGMVTIESLACGTPVLGSNAGGTPEILNTNEGGLLFETLNSDDLAVKIDEICKSEIKLNADALLKMAKHYDHTKVCKMVEETLNL